MASSLADRASTVSRSSGAAAGHSNANHSQSSAVRSVSADASSPDSPSIGFGPAQVSAPGTPGTPGPSSRRIASGVSGLSDTDRSHLRQISEASAISSVDSSVAAGGGGLSAPIAGMGYTSGPILMDHPTVASPVTMPTPSGALGGSDYVSAGQAAAAARGAEAVGAGPSSPATPGQPGGARAEQPPTSPMRRSVFYENEEDMGGNSK